MPYLSNIFRSLRTPTVPAKRPSLELSKILLIHQTRLQTSRYVARRILSAITSEPSRDCILAFFNLASVGTVDSLAKSRSDWQRQGDLAFISSNQFDLMRCISLTQANHDVARHLRYRPRCNRGPLTSVSSGYRAGNMILTLLCHVCMDRCA